MQCDNSVIYDQKLDFGKEIGQYDELIYWRIFNSDERTVFFGFLFVISTKKWNKKPPTLYLQCSHFTHNTQK